MTTEKSVYVMPVADIVVLDKAFLGASLEWDPASYNANTGKGESYVPNF